MSKTVSTKWYKLDNAAKMIPSSAHGADTRVFRICCELAEEVDGALLQEALEEVIEEFPLYNCTLKRGFFWYYLEDLGYCATVTEDDRPACAPLYFAGRKNLLYRLTYFHHRINLEMFHVLADGTGAFTFLKRILMVYLSKKHNLPAPASECENASVTEKSNDAFDQFYEKSGGLSQLRNMTSVKAYQLTGPKDENLAPHLLEGRVSAKKFLQIAKSYDTTAGVLATAIYIESVIGTMPERRKNHPIVVSVPVNLRQFFPSDTTRNFFGVINIAYDAREYDGTLEGIIRKVKEKFSDLLQADKVASTMNGYTYLEHNIGVKVVPLFLKDIGIGIAGSMSQKGVTSTMSNLGLIKMPTKYEPYIRYFSAFMTAQAQQICISTFKDEMVFGEVSPFVTHEVMMRFFRKLTSLGLSVTIATNDYDADPHGTGKKEAEA